VDCSPLFLKERLLRKGLDLSEIFLSDSNNFNYDNINNLVVFGDSHSNGNNKWPNQLSKIHKMLLWNYSKTGAVIDLNITYRGPGQGSFDFRDEYDSFNNTMVSYKNFIKWKGSNTLFAIHLGSNDIKVVYLKKSNYNGDPDYAEYVNNNKPVNENIENIIRILFNNIKKIYVNGGRNFLIFNIPPLELANVSAKRKKNYKSGIPIFNSLLKKEAKNFFEDYNDVNIIIYDLNEKYRNIINNFEDYNFVSGKEMYISHKNETDINKYFWRDNTHLTEKGNIIIAESIDALLKSL